MATKKEDADQTKEDIEEVDESEEVDDESQDESEDTNDDQDTSDKDGETAEEDGDEGEDDADATADEDAEDSDDDSETFDKRFTQFKGDELPEYTKNLEEGYAQSTAEAQRLNKILGDYKQKFDKITAMVANDPELAEKLEVGAASPDPALNYARQEMEAKMKQEYDSFQQDHPEIETDPALGDKLTKRLAIISKAVYDDEQRMVGMKEGLEMAWTSLGLGNNQEETTRMAAKNVAAQSKTTSAKKPTPKSEFTPSQLEFAQRMGLTEKELRASLSN